MRKVNKRKYRKRPIVTGYLEKVSSSIFDKHSKIIAEIRQQLGIAVLLVEQNARLALKLADWGYVLVTGSIVLQGSGQELLNNEEVKRAYLGM